MAIVEAIQTQRVEVDAGISSFDFSGFGTSYRHLQLRVSAVSIGTGTSSPGRIRFGTGGSPTWQTGNVYSTHGHQAYDGNNIDGQWYGTSESSVYVGVDQFAGVPGTWTAGLDDYGATVIDIADYNSSTRHKTVRAMSLGYSSSKRGSVGIHSGTFLSTSAITGVRFFISGNIARGSVATLYGIKDS